MITALWHGLRVRRLVRHALAGAGAATFAVIAGVTALGAPATTTLALPVPMLRRRARRRHPAGRRPVGRGAARRCRASARTVTPSAPGSRPRPPPPPAARRRPGRPGHGDRPRSRRRSRRPGPGEGRGQGQGGRRREEAAGRDQGAGVRGRGHRPAQMASRSSTTSSATAPTSSPASTGSSSTRATGTSTRRTPSSGAYGLPQSLPGSKMASVASDWRDNPATQIIWGAKYMKSRYGSPCGAKSHWQSPPATTEPSASAQPVLSLSKAPALRAL